MSFISIDAKQLQQLDRGMSRYRNAVPKRVTDGALRKALRPMLRAAQAEVPVGKGNERVSLKRRGATANDFRRGGATKRDLRIKAVRAEGDEITRLIVGVSKKKGKVGWRTHFITRGTKRTRKNDFLQRAYDSTIAEVSMIYQRELYERFMEWGRQNLPQNSI